MSSRAVVNSYTGANVSIFIGDTLITNAFGITWELSAGKRPIFGYNGLHQQAFATGQVMLLGSLYLNFQHPNYLSYVLKKYYELKREIQSSGDNSLAVARIKNSRANLVNEFRNLNPGQTLSPATLNELFNDKAMQAQLIPALTAGEILNVKASSGVVYNNYKKGMTFDRNLEPEEKTSKWAVYARPDQFVGAEDTKDAIDIVVTFGNPGLKGRPGSTATYQTGSGIILRGVNFLGEGMTVMSDDQPVMEVYKFMAASKDYLAADALSEDDIAELTQFGRANQQQKDEAERVNRDMRNKVGLPGGLPPRGGTEGGEQDVQMSVDTARGAAEAADAARAAAAARMPATLPVPDPEGSRAPQAKLPAEGEKGTTTPTPRASSPPDVPTGTPSVKVPGSPPAPVAVEPEAPSSGRQEGDDPQ